MGPEDLFKMQTHIEKLTSRNFESWCIRIEALFAGKQISDVLVNEYPDAGSAGYDAFKKNDKTGMAIIVQTVSDEYLRLIKDKTCKQAMQALKDRLERTGALSRLYARREFQSLKHEMRDNIPTFLIKFDSCIERMESGGLTVTEEEKITQLLISMPTEYNSVITAIETMAARDSTMSVEFVKNRLLDEEIKLKKGNALSHNRDVAFLTCYNCGKTGHIKKDCRSRGRGRQGSREHNERRATEKRSPGTAHDKQQRYKDKPNRSRRNDTEGSNGRARTAQANREEEEDSVTFCSQAGTIYYTDEDKSTRFVLDSGASHHMIRKELFDFTYNRRKLNKPIVVKVAKEDQAIIVLEIADINLKYKGRKIILTDVLCAAQLKCNLLSIKRLEERGFQVEFKNGSGHIYRRNKLIAKTQPGSSLYDITFDTTSKSKENQANLALRGDQTIWHRRLGHSCAIKPDSVCRICIEAKMSKQPHTGTRPRMKYVLEKIHMDLCGPINPVGIDGEKYFLTIVDDYSHFIVVYPIRSKDEVHESLEDFKHKYENKLGRRIKKIRCDAGTEFVNNTMRKIFKAVEFEVTPPYTHALNGVAERTNRTLTEMARAMIIDKNVEKYLWPYAVMYAAYILNRLPSKAINDEIPAKKAEAKIDYMKVKIFGCETYSHIENQFRGRFDSKAKKMKFVGMTNTGYKVYDPENRRVYTRSDVKFIEADEEEQKTMVEIEPEEQEVTGDSSCKNENKEDEPYEENKNGRHNNEEKVKQTEPTKRILPQRNRAPPARYADYRAHIAEIEELYEEELTYDEAIKSGWKDAINDETRNIMENQTWEPVQDNNQSRIDAVWKFKTKIDPDGKKAKKARLVARGCKQDKSESIYAHVPGSTTIKVFLAIAANRQLEITQMDVKAAYLNSYLKEEVYMTIPKGFPAEGSLCRLNKAIYGLRQASQAWTTEFESFMKGNNFLNSEVDTCLYRKHEPGKGITYVLHYVDDILVASSSAEEIKRFKTKLKQRYKTKEIDEIKRFIGLEINRTENYITISQTSHVKKLLQVTGLEMAKPRSTPMEPNTKHVSSMCKSGCEAFKTKYRRLIGNLLYLSQHTRPDITYSVNYLSRFQNNPTEEHYAAVKRIIRYLSGTTDYGLLYTKDEPENMYGYADASWAEDIEDRKSTTGYCFMVCGKLVLWRSLKQSMVTLSSCEAEYVSLSEAVREERYIKALCKFLDLSVESCTMYEDNQSAIAVASNTESRRGKSIDIRYHSVREAVKNGEIDLMYVKSEDNIADIFTKPLGTLAFSNIRKKIITNLSEVKT